MTRTHADDDLRRAALGVLMPGFAGTSLPTWIRPAIADGLASVCLFAMNTPTPAATRHLTDEIASLNPDLLVVTDEEGGDVSRLQAATGSSLPGNEALGVLDDAETTRQVGAAIGSLLRAAGVHLTLAPVLDVASNPANPVISVRSLGADPDLVARHGRALLEGLHDAGVGGCPKHFPGHGDTAVDSHVGLPVIDVDEQTLRTRDVAPFAAAADLADAVMTAHLVVPALGGYAASLSRWSSELLRGAGFAGPIITDALGMQAVSRGDAGHPAGLGEACVRALEAGADLLCLDAPQNRDPETAFRQAVEAIIEALHQGRLDADALRRSHERTVATTRRVLARPGWQADAPVDLEAIAALGHRVARAALHVTGTPTTTPHAWLVDLRSSVNWAAGDLGSVVLDTLDAARARVGQQPLTPVAPDRIDTVPADESLILVTRAPLSDDVEAALLSRALSSRRDAIVLHTGMAQAAPSSQNLICSHGLGRPNLAAAAQAMAAPTTEDHR